MTNEMKNIIRMFISAIFVAFAIAGIFSAFTFESKMEEAFQNGYEQAIMDAELVSIDGNEYAISFNGELHSYVGFSYESKMEEIRQQTIEEAVLVSSDEDGYTISFGGELHSYTFD